MVGVAHDLEGRRFGRRNAHSSARRVFLYYRRAPEIMARHEHHANFAANERPAILGRHDLEALRMMMRRSVNLSRAQQGDIVGLVQLMHELWDELLRRQTAEFAIFGRDDDVKAAKWGRDLASLLKPTQRRADGG